MKKLKNSFVFRNNFCVLYFQKIKKCQSCITLADEVWNACFAFKNNESWSAFMYLVNRNENVKFGGTPLNAKIYIFWYFFGCNLCAGIYGVKNSKNIVLFLKFSAYYYHALQLLSATNIMKSVNEVARNFYVKLRY